MSSRHIVQRTRGHRHGPVTRLMSPGDLGKVLKPFVFLDLFDLTGPGPGGLGLHPHSGIATLSWIAQGSVNYEDTSGKTGVITEGGVEWMVAGAGVWHGGGWSGTTRTRGFQLWVALPAALELGPPESIYLAPESLPQAGPAQVLLGQYRDAASSLPAPSPMNYVVVRLKAKEHWRYQPPPGHTVAWVAVSGGSVNVPDSVAAGELAVFNASDGAIDFHADIDTEFVLGSAVPHPHELVLGNYSVHTSAKALQDGEARIGLIGQSLREQGRLR